MPNTQSPRHAARARRERSVRLLVATAVVVGSIVALVLVWTSPSEVTITDTQSSAPLHAADPPASAALDLPRIPWEGGPAYWTQFDTAAAAGWDNPDFFPIVAWFGDFSTDEDVAYDKSLGINTYSGMWKETPYDLFRDNGVFWIGDKLNDTFTDDSANWVGYFLDDEVDGRFPVDEGQARLQSIVDSRDRDGRFRYANFTRMVLSSDLSQAAGQQYVNGYTDVVSTDEYWYTNQFCSYEPYRDIFLTPVDQANCRTASSYGKMMNSLRTRDEADGKLQPLWQWVENYSGSPSGTRSVVISPGQLKGAVMNSIINEARGIAYFNQSLTGSCVSGNNFRQSQVTPGFCANDQIAAVKQINEQIHQLARVINTQSYEFSFGDGLDTMLKTADSEAYIFAMIDGSSSPGRRAFQLPAGIKGTSATVVAEDRTIPVDDSGRFTDVFAQEYSYHIYRIGIG